MCVCIYIYYESHDIEIETINKSIYRATKEQSLCSLLAVFILGNTALRTKNISTVKEILNNLKPV
jgi:hypothetical protein